MNFNFFRDFKINQFDFNRFTIDLLIFLLFAIVFQISDSRVLISVLLFHVRSILLVYLLSVFFSSISFFNLKISLSVIRFLFLLFYLFHFFYQISFICYLLYICFSHFKIQ